MIIAFFPCVRFEDQILLSFRGDLFQMKNYTQEQKLERCLLLHDELHENYSAITKLSIICLKRGIKLVIENPYSVQHYLTKYWCVKPKIIDSDRTERGDYYKKPTQYWFFNFDPENNLIMEPIECVERKAITRIKKDDGINRTVARSMIHPQYANRFIREHLIDE